MPPPAASPAIRLSADGVTYGAAGVKLAVAASATVWAKLDNIANVNQVSWSVVATDGSALPGSFVITVVASVVPGGNVVSLPALGLGTAGRLQATVNAGVGAYGNGGDPTTKSVVKWHVLAANGREVGTVGEQFESDSVNGTAPLINAAITNNNGAGALVGSQVALGPAGQWTMGPVVTGTSTSNASTSTSAALATLTIPPSSSVTTRVTIKGRIDLLPTVSVFADLAGVIGTVRPASGNADPVVTNSDAVRALAVVAPFSGADGGFVLTGNSLAIGAGLGTIPAWVNTTAYTAGPAGTARHVVTNDSGKLYVCITAGTSAGSGGPTGTGSNIADGTAHWAYVGASITINWTLLPETLVG